LTSVSIAAFFSQPPILDCQHGAYGDHGGAQESVQRVPMVFWSRSLAKRGGHASHGPFQTADVMPTILKALGIPLTAPVDGKARPLRR
jgi:arylsulfatase A-like enzyme